MWVVAAALSCSSFWKNPFPFRNLVFTHFTAKKLDLWVFNMFPGHFWNVFLSCSGYF